MRFRCIWTIAIGLPFVKAARPLSLVDEGNSFVYSADGPYEKPLKNLRDLPSVGDSYNLPSTGRKRILYSVNGQLVEPQYVAQTFAQAMLAKLSEDLDEEAQLMPVEKKSVASLHRIMMELDKAQRIFDARLDQVQDFMWRFENFLRNNRDLELEDRPKANILQPQTEEAADNDESDA